MRQFVEEVTAGRAYGRRLNLSAIPKTGMPIVTIDLDLTLNCNMQCVYCFKEKDHREMQERVAFDAIVWLLHASGPARDLFVALMGGEPLLRFDLIKRLVPFGKRRAAYHGKQIHFSATTNNTLVTDEVVEFWRAWGSGFHSSIDGIPDVQNTNRPMANGAPSSHAAEKGIEKILRYAPRTTARSTILPDNARYIVDNFRYFRSLGFQDIAMMPGCPGEWTDASNAVFEQQFQDVADLVIDEMRNGRFVRLSGVDAYITSYVNGQERPTHMCGAGRGMALIDTVGNIWPCHRWNKARHTNWCMGSIYEEFSEEARMTLDVPNQTQHIKANCERCAANAVCNGACPAESLEDNLDTYKPSPNTCRQLRVWARLARYIHDTLRAEENPVFLRHYYPRQNGGGATGTGDDARKTTTDSPAA